MKLIHVAASAVAATLCLSVSAASAAIIPATGATVVQLGVDPTIVEPFGTATEVGGEDSNQFSFPVTGIERLGDITTLYHVGSGLVIGGLQLSNFTYSLPLPTTLTGNVPGVEDELDLLSIDENLQISLTATAGDALGFPEGTVVGNVVSVEFEPTSVPEPGSVVLLGGALAVAARRLRRR